MQWETKHCFPTKNFAHDSAHRPKMVVWLLLVPTLIKFSQSWIKYLEKFLWITIFSWPHLQSMDSPLLEMNVQFSLRVCGLLWQLICLSISVILSCSCWDLMWSNNLVVILKKNLIWILKRDLHQSLQTWSIFVSSDLKMYYFTWNVDEYTDEPKHYDNFLYVLLANCWALLELWRCPWYLASRCQLQIV